jgi:hypothetical protein
MKRLHLIVLVVTLLLSQMGTLDHVYSAHRSGEVCDYCLSVPSLGHALSNFIQTDFSINATQHYVELAQVTHFASTRRFYAARAPPLS